MLCTPPQIDGSIPASVLYAAQQGRRPLRGEDRRRPGGGRHGLRHRIDPEVDRIVGPGNAYVTEAKRQVAGIVGIDGLAGPSELAIVADGDVDIDMAALDLIAQAEHDPEARTFFITPDPDLVDRVAKALDEALAGRRPPRDRRRRARLHEGRARARPRSSRRRS